MVYVTFTTCVPAEASPFVSSAKLPPEVEVIPPVLHQPSLTASIVHPLGAPCPLLSKVQSEGTSKLLTQKEVEGLQQNLMELKQDSLRQLQL